MIIAGLILIPLAGALAAWLGKSGRFSKIVLNITAVIHTVLCGLLVPYGSPLHITGTLTLAADRDGLIILTVTSVLFLFTALHLNFWLPQDMKKSGGHSGIKSYTFASLLQIFLMTMTLTALARDFGMLWVAVEATTLASAPLINFHKSKGSLEAMWKYLLICSVGIGLALFGTMIIAAALSYPHCDLGFASVKELINSGSVNILWFKIGFVLFFAGYALKMGLAPFHSWLPDAHSEAPAPVSALLSGSLLNCAFLAILRLCQIIPGQLQDFCAGYLKFFGFFSLAVAVFFIINQKDFKRMLAYSSVEHMGLIALFTAYGLTDYGMLHVVSHSLTKMALFLVAGNILLSYNTRNILDVRGLSDRLPRNGMLWICGMLLICGTPPSPLFFTELILVTGTGILPGAAILLLLLVIFCAMSRSMLQMISPEDKKTETDPETDRLAVVPAAAMMLVTALGIAIGTAWIIKG